MKKNRQDRPADRTPGGADKWRQKHRSAKPTGDTRKRGHAGTHPRPPGLHHGQQQQAAPQRPNRSTDTPPSRVVNAPSSSLVVSTASARCVEAGHPWVLRDRSTGETGARQPGDVVDLLSPEGLWLAKALLDPGHRVVARVLTRDHQQTCDRQFFRDRALEAWHYRQGLGIDATVYRVIHGEADGLPGLTIDRYENYLVAQLYTAASLPLADAAIETLLSTGVFAGAFLKSLPRDRRGKGEQAHGDWVTGDPGPEALTCLETGVRYKVRPFAGLSTGIFPDQRDNRRRVAELASGRRVLNAFAYTGAFSVTCALAGATVDTLDLSASYLEWARENFALNGLEVHPDRFIQADVLEFLTRPPQRYDMVILDPPTFSTSRSNVWGPNRITELNALAMDALEPGGWLVTMSNYSKFSEADFSETLRMAALEVRKRLRLATLLQAGMDYPWLPGFPESRHLKGAIVQVSPR